MTIKALAGRGSASPFFDTQPERMSRKSASRKRKVSHREAADKKRRTTPTRLLDGVVNGERVLIAEIGLDAESERSVEIRTRVALAAEGVLVMKHRVESCPHCGGRPKKTSGLGKGASDLICVVPPYGRVCFIEMKRPGYVPSAVSRAQRCFISVVKRFGGVSGVASSVEEALALVALARRLP